MTPGRGDRAAPPAPEGHWEVRFADAASAKGWESLTPQARENTYRAWTIVRTAPRPVTETPRHHRLKGGLAHGTHRGQTCERGRPHLTAAALAGRELRKEEADARCIRRTPCPSVSLGPMRTQLDVAVGRGAVVAVGPGVPSGDHEGQTDSTPRLGNRLGR
ncbi:hypothetical protein ACWD25_01320 [Streptomyces sp. NPDC002920]